jgi:hypothetical protein
MFDGNPITDRLINTAPVKPSKLVQAEVTMAALKRQNDAIRAELTVVTSRRVGPERGLDVAGIRELEADLERVRDRRAELGQSSLSFSASTQQPPQRRCARQLPALQ